MRTVEIGTQNFTKVSSLDEPSFGGARHSYLLTGLGEDPPVYGTVEFQRGPVKEEGVNGCHHEDLLIIVLDRLNAFQSGDYRCRENALAITKIEEAMHWLHHRTTLRKNRSVEGTSQI